MRIFRLKAVRKSEFAPRLDEPVVAAFASEFDLTFDQSLLRAIHTTHFSAPPGYEIIASIAFSERGRFTDTIGGETRISPRNIPFYLLPIMDPPVEPILLAELSFNTTQEAFEMDNRLDFAKCIREALRSATTEFVQESDDPVQRRMFGFVLEHVDTPPDAETIQVPGTG
jgi:hypothetical protein